MLYVYYYGSLDLEKGEIIMLTAMGDVLRECYKQGWISTRDGNISLRKSLDGNISDQVYITPKGVRKNMVRPEDIIKFNIKEIDQLCDVSTEVNMHKNLLLDAKTTRCVLHVHPTFTVAAMYAGIDLQKITEEFPEIKRYTKVGLSVPKCEAGSHDLANMTNNHFRKDGEVFFDIVGQKNHGVCAVGKHPWDCFEHIERLEHICQIVMLAKK